jgi:hypothetical protein
MSRDANVTNSSAKAIAELNGVLRMLNQQQLVVVGCTVGSFAFHVLVAAGVLPLYWFVPFLFLSAEALNFVLIALSDIFGKKRATKNRVNQTTDHESSFAPNSNKLGKNATGNDTMSSSAEATDRRQNVISEKFSTSQLAPATAPQ